MKKEFIRWLYIIFVVFAVWYHLTALSFLSIFLLIFRIPFITTTKKRKQSFMEKIKEAAIKKDKAIFVGRRHSEIVKANPQEHFNFENSTQGFITDSGKFVNRQEDSFI